MGGDNSDFRDEVVVLSDDDGNQNNENDQADTNIDNLNSYNDDEENQYDDDETVASSIHETAIRMRYDETDDENTNASIADDDTSENTNASIADDDTSENTNASLDDDTSTSNVLLDENNDGDDEDNYDDDDDDDDEDDDDDNYSLASLSETRMSDSQNMMNLWLNDKNKQTTQHIILLTENEDWTSLEKTLVNLKAEMGLVGHDINDGTLDLYNDEYIIILFLGFQCLVACYCKKEENDSSLPSMIQICDYYLTMQPKLLAVPCQRGYLPIHDVIERKNMSLLQWMMHNDPESCLVVQHDLTHYNMHKSMLKFCRFPAPSALHMAVEVQWEEGVNYLLQIIEDDQYPPYTSDKKAIATVMCYVGVLTPLHAACLNCTNESIVRNILRFYPNAASVKDGDRGFLPFDLALESDFDGNDKCYSANLLRELLDAYPEVATRVKVNSNYCKDGVALHMACSNPYHVAIDILLDAKPDGATHKDAKGRFPINCLLHGYQGIYQLFPSSTLERLIQLSPPEAFVWSNNRNDDDDDTQPISAIQKLLQYQIDNAFKSWKATYSNLDSTERRTKINIMNLDLVHSKAMSMAVRKLLSFIGCDEEEDLLQRKPNNIISFLCFVSGIFHPTLFSIILKEALSDIRHIIVKDTTKSENHNTLSSSINHCKRTFNELMGTTTVKGQEHTINNYSESNKAGVVVESNQSLLLLHDLYSFCDGAFLTSKYLKSTIKDEQYEVWCKSDEEASSWLDGLLENLPKTLLEEQAHIMDHDGYLPLHRLLLHRPWTIQIITYDLKTSKKRKKSSTGNSVYHPLAFMKGDIDKLLSLNFSSFVTAVGYNYQKGMDRNRCFFSGIRSRMTNNYSRLSPFMLVAVDAVHPPCLDSTYKLLKLFVTERSLTNLTVVEPQFLPDTVLGPSKTKKQRI